MPSCHFFFGYPHLFLLITYCLPSFAPYQPHWFSFCPTKGSSSSPAQHCLTCCFLCENVPPPDCSRCLGLAFPKKFSPVTCLMLSLATLHRVLLSSYQSPLSDLILFVVFIISLSQLVVHSKRIGPRSFSWLYLLCLECG